MNLNDVFAYLTEKFPTIVASALAAILFVLLEIRQHSLFTAVVAILSGIMVATLATTPIIEFWNLPSSAEHAIAGILGITGRNLIIWVGRAAKDPAKFWQTLRGGSDDE